MQLINKSQNEFTDISSEEFREYLFPDGSIVKIYHPLWVAVSKSGGHRILSEDGISHYIPSGWIHLSWKAAPGEPHFVK
jgi:hypothetical protein